jgi:hypothetical protein
MEKFPGNEPGQHRLVADPVTGELVKPEDLPQKLEATAFYVDDQGQPISVPEIPPEPVLEAQAFYDDEKEKAPPANAAEALHQELAAAGLLELVMRLPENDKRHVKEIPVKDLADLALALYLETKGIGSRLWRDIQPDDPRYLELRRKVLEIAEAVAKHPVEQNIFVVKAIKQMKMAVGQAASSILQGRG